jgi:ABC-2 type transport system permease protein
MSIAIADPKMMTSSSSGRSLFRHTFALTRRSVVGRLRQPAVLAPAFIFPLFFAALGSASFNKLASDPYFTDNIATSFMNYAVAGAILQGVLFGSTSAAGDLATDIEQGFFERLLASPISRTAIVLGRLVGSMVIAVVQVVVFLSIFLVAGAATRPVPRGAGMRRTRTLPQWPVSLLGTVCGAPVRAPPQ